MNKKIFTILCLVIISILVSGCSGGSAVLSILPGAEETGAGVADEELSLQQMIDRAEEGSEILIKAGTYEIDQPLMVEGKKELSIKGEGNVIIIGEDIDEQIFIIKDCGKIRLENIRARHKSNEGSQEKKVFEKRSGSVVDISAADYVGITGCELEGCGVYGLYAEDTKEIKITGSYIHHNSWRALGLHAYRVSMNVEITGCTITNNTDFVEKEGSVNINLIGQNIIKFNNPEGYKNR